MKRRSFRHLRPDLKDGHNSAQVGKQLSCHHHVYVVLLDSEVVKDPEVKRENPGRDPAKPCLYVGMTGLDPKERFRNHKEGIKSSRYVKRYGLRLLPEFYDYLNPMPYEVAVRMEEELAEDLRRQGFTVTGGH